MLPSSNRLVNMHRPLPPETAALLRRGTVIPAHPLALDARRQLDERRQRALARYYLDAGSGGLAVGVHATQFAIREAGLYEPVLRIAAEEGILHGKPADISKTQFPQRVLRLYDQLDPQAERPLPTGRGSA